MQASEADFQVELHDPDWIKLGNGVRVCAICGRFPNGVYWGKAPGQPGVGADGETWYVQEQAS